MSQTLLLQQMGLLAEMVMDSDLVLVPSCSRVSQCRLFPQLPPRQRLLGEWLLKNRCCFLLHSHPHRMQTC